MRRASVPRPPSPRGRCSLAASLRRSSIGQDRDLRRGGRLSARRRETRRDHDLEEGLQVGTGLRRRHGHDLSEGNPRGYARGFVVMGRAPDGIREGASPDPASQPRSSSSRHRSSLLRSAARGPRAPSSRRGRRPHTAAGSRCTGRPSAGRARGIRLVSRVRSTTRRGPGGSRGGQAAPPHDAGAPARHRATAGSPHTRGADARL